LKTDSDNGNASSAFKHPQCIILIIFSFVLRRGHTGGPDGRPNGRQCDTSFSFAQLKKHGWKLKIIPVWQRLCYQWKHRRYKYPSPKMAVVIAQICLSLQLPVHQRQERSNVVQHNNTRTKK